MEDVIEACMLLELLSAAQLSSDVMKLPPALPWTAHPRVPSAHHVVVLLWCGHVMGCSRRTIGIRWVLQVRLEVEVGSLNKCTLVR